MEKKSGMCRQRARNLPEVARAADPCQRDRTTGCAGLAPGEKYPTCEEYTPMIRHGFMALVMLAALLGAAQSVSAVTQENVKTDTATQQLAGLNGAARREAIREMPLLERPNRPGHFYGNTVRRIAERRANRA
jgi:hypothetical protein